MSQKNALVKHNSLALYLHGMKKMVETGRALIELIDISSHGNGQRMGWPHMKGLFVGFTERKGRNGRWDGLSRRVQW